MDVLEIEIKSYCDDHAAVIEKLRSMGARLDGTKHEHDLYLNHPDRDFRLSDEALRLRRVDGAVILTYKGPKISPVAKTRVEEEVTVSEFDTTLKILKMLGFTESGTIDKMRDLFILDDMEICIDRVDGLGNFVELETRGVHREEAEEKLFRLAGELGLSRFERKSYLELKYGEKE